MIPLQPAPQVAHKRSLQPANQRARQHQRGVAMLESLIAIVILSIGLIGTMGLQARTVVAMSHATLRSQATIAGERLIAQIFNDQSNAASYVVAAGGTPPAALLPWFEETQRLIPGATIKVSLAGATTNYRQVNIEISWILKGNTANRNTHKVSAHIASSQ